MRGAGGFLFLFALSVCLCGRLLSGAHLLHPDGRVASPASFSPASSTLVGVGSVANAANFRHLSAIADDKVCGLDLGGTTNSSKFVCSMPGCADKVAGYFNYLDLLYCRIGALGPRVAVCLVMLLWVAFLLHIVESTTNDYFVTSLQLAVSILRLSPNIAGVTFLAVGNAACDVIASIAAIQADSVDVGVGTTVGAGIFVTCGEGGGGASVLGLRGTHAAPLAYRGLCGEEITLTPPSSRLPPAVIAAVAFVADVRLPRRSFLRDIIFYLISVVYLIIVCLDQYISVAEASGFFGIYAVYLAVVFGGRCLRQRGLTQAADLVDDNEEEEAASDRAEADVAAAAASKSSASPYFAAAGAAPLSPAAAK